MTFHQSPEFTDALEATAAHFKIRPVYIEKDYWVTYVLRNLSNSIHVDEVVFKGGTSLSKAHNCIQRFSEDIDLALTKDSDTSDNQLKKKMKTIEGVVSNGLEYFQHEKEEKRGRNRRTFYHYTKALPDSNFGLVKDHIQLEINTFTNPVPHQKISVSSYVSQFLEQGGFHDIVAQFQLEPFAINVLTRERTFFEKLLSLIRLSYEGPDKLKEKIRHFYDLQRLLDQQDLAILDAKHFEIVNLVKADDNSNDIFRGAWLDKPLSKSPLFSDVKKSWGEVESIYKKDLGDLIWSDLPSSEEIVDALSRINDFLQSYDDTVRKT